jgi:hypothetical protein
MRLAAIVVLLIVAGGCGNDEVSEGPKPDKRFQGDDYSFSYPGDWEERAPDPASASADVHIAPEPGAAGVSVGTFEVPEAITASNIDDHGDELIAAAADFVESTQAGTPSPDGDVLEVTIAGFPGVEFEGSSAEAETKVTWFFDGKTAYAVVCRSPSDSDADVSTACDQVLSTFDVD